MSDAVTASPVYNPFDPEFRANPYPFYDVLREHAPQYYDNAEEA